MVCLDEGCRRRKSLSQVAAEHTRPGPLMRRELFTSVCKGILCLDKGCQKQKSSARVAQAPMVL
jgi:hypothetical protein